MEDQGSFSLNNPDSWNYRYDAAGRLTGNRHDGVALIEYTAYGKVRRVVPTDNSRPTLEYSYDTMQQRLSKTLLYADGSSTATYYAYDATGVLMATYTHKVNANNSNNTLTLNDFMLYGSSRLGSYVVNEPAGGSAPVALTAANLRFELCDHLGTVRAVVTGQKSSTGEAEIVSLTDYYPYGMDMPGRSFSSEAYRYGYQGSERDPEMSGGAGYTTFFRALDPRIGRWLTPDPKVFPWQSPYVSMDGNPVALIDPWGASTGGDYVDQPTANSGNAAPGAKYKDNAGRVFQNRGDGLGWAEITPPSATANTPVNGLFGVDVVFSMSVDVDGFGVISNDYAEQFLAGTEIIGSLVEGANEVYMKYDESNKFKSGSIAIKKAGNAIGLISLTKTMQSVASDGYGNTSISSMPSPLEIIPATAPLAAVADMALDLHGVEVEPDLNKMSYYMFVNHVDRVNSQSNYPAIVLLYTTHELGTLPGERLIIRRAMPGSVAWRDKKEASEVYGFSVRFVYWGKLEDYDNGNFFPRGFIKVD